ncbi:hypothetical protein [Streptococcus halichoeri]|uniref:hypothetical protein n=1 Tax=Streptococcus halichoeri TaxID=254785 RepID=UPI001358FFF4|nr:hypothetical protein [Streptococcus halichoeri]
MLNTIKNHLSESIQTIVSHKEKYISSPEKQFSFEKILSFETVIRTILPWEENPCLKNYWMVTSYLQARE